MVTPLIANLASLVQRSDPDRYLTALFAPAALRPTLFALYAFNHELARAREAASEPTLALIRLQWWREVVEGQTRQHEVATPLAEALAKGALHAPDLLAMIEARECEAQPDMATLEDWRNWLLAGPGSLAVAAGKLLGADKAAQHRLRLLGAGYGAAGILRSIAPMAKAGRCLLPTEILATHGLDIHAAIADPNSAAMNQVRATLTAQGKTLLGTPRRTPPGIIAAALPAVLARRDLRHLPHQIAPPPKRGLGDRLAVTAAALARLA